jgi:hypothetical protein
MGKRVNRLKKKSGAYMDKMIQSSAPRTKENFWKRDGSIEDNKRLRRLVLLEWKKKNEFFWWRFHEMANRETE